MKSLVLPFSVMILALWIFVSMQEDAVMQFLLGQNCSVEINEIIVSRTDTSQAIFYSKIYNHSLVYDRVFHGLLYLGLLSAFAFVCYKVEHPRETRATALISSLMFVPLWFIQSYCLFAVSGFKMDDQNLAGLWLIALCFSPFVVGCFIMTWNEKRQQCFAV